MNSIIRKCSDWVGDPFESTSAPWEILYSKGDEISVGQGIRISRKDLYETLSLMRKGE